MNILKIGHCCLVVEEAAVKIMIDPGAWTTGQNEVTGLAAIFITHEHADHFHLDSLKIVLKNNPDAKVYTNSGVGKMLDEAGIAYEVVEEGQRVEVAGLSLEAFGHEHADIYTGIPRVMNSGFMVAERMYYPGDAFALPGKPVEILALPVAGPWMKMADALDFAKAVKPKVAFPVHDGFLAFPGPFHGVPGKLLPDMGIEFKPLLAGESLTV
ncbi:MAG: MBL fold metallo-hydrolase [Candidatus Andersenbacteria bacterium]|nr:MBL fold metallo-hydrolase [Candidatus Andersenbacteria bacterium]